MPNDCCFADETCLSNNGLCCGVGSYSCNEMNCCDNDTEACLIDGPQAGTCCPFDQACGETCCPNQGDKCLPGYTCCPPESVCGKTCCGPFSVCADSSGDGICCAQGQHLVEGLCCNPNEGNCKGVCCSGTCTFEEGCVPTTSGCQAVGGNGPCSAAGNCGPGETCTNGCCFEVPK
jgi:hypothetical protein